jgi:hypothetical protein
MKCKTRHVLKHITHTHTHTPAFSQAAMTAEI